MKCLLVALLCMSAALEITSKQIAPRIVGGAPARAGQLPFIGALYITTPDGTFFCSGTLINHSWLLTTAQCVDNATSIIIRLGTIHLSGTATGQVQLSTDEYYIHDGFDGGFENNIAAIKLRLPITYSTYVKPVDFLPSEDLPEGSSVLASGWGQVDDETPGLVDELRWVNLVTLSTAECQLTFGSIISDTTVCVDGNFNQGICNGDNGGPLIQYVSRGHTQLVGLASFQSQRGCESTDPSGYVKTYPYREWVTTITGL